MKDRQPRSSVILDLFIVGALLVVGWILLNTLHNRDEVIGNLIVFIEEHGLTEQYNEWLQDNGNE